MRNVDACTIREDRTGFQRGIESIHFESWMIYLAARQAIYLDCAMGGEK
jgi:hypothetical protein